MKSNIGQEIMLWLTSFLLSIGAILTVCCIIALFWYIWTCFEDKSIGVTSTLVIVSTTVAMRSFLKG